MLSIVNLLHYDYTPFGLAFKGLTYLRPLNTKQPIYLCENRLAHMVWVKEEGMRLRQRSDISQTFNWEERFGIINI